MDLCQPGLDTHVEFEEIREPGAQRHGGVEILDLELDLLDAEFRDVQADVRLTDDAWLAGIVWLPSHLAFARAVPVRHAQTPASCTASGTRFPVPNTPSDTANLGGRGPRVERIGYQLRDSKVYRFADQG